MTIQSSAFSLDSGAMELIERKFQEKQQIAQTRAHELFDIFREELTAEETWALKYLYAYMPVNDLADYDGPLFLSHVRRTLDIRGKVPWGRRVPDYLFLHFVLPYRVNTENIEDSRGLLYNELAERTAHLPMADAILETNYWCHEKATYTGSDLRTVSPLTMLRSARGRCGEESTLAVAALRSIGIPARQVYTPRWAHCDDNHAWVEAWADGSWHYIGACEPEPRLNQGWFSPPARRAMLINTRIFANYPGPEDITFEGGWFTEINLLEGYAPTRTVAVLVMDERNRPVSGADVYFELYNYAELFPIAELPTDSRGEASFKTGFGDLVVRAVKDGRWGEIKINAEDRGPIEIVLDQARQPEGTADIDMVPPPERNGDSAEPLAEELLQQHNKRLEKGTRLRASFENTFMDETQAADLAQAAGLPADRVWEVLRKARGNDRELAAFLKERSGEYGEWPLRLLESLNAKDLIDTFRPALDDHLTGSMALIGELAEDIFIRYVLCPRVLYEMIVPYKQFFQAAFTGAEVASFKEAPAELARRLETGFSLWEDLPNLKGKGNPAGTYKLGKGDRLSLYILFVAACRSLGIPARLHPSEQKPQYLADGAWRDAIFADGSEDRTEKKENGRLLLIRDDRPAAGTPAASYSENFTFARLESGIYKTLVYPYGESDVYAEPFELKPGSYRLTTGVRLKDGTARVRLSYFTVRSGELTAIPLTYRESSVDIPVLGAMKRNDLFRLPDGSFRTLGDLAGTDGAVVAWIEPEREPTKHLIREMTELAGPFKDLGAPILLVAGDSEWSASFDPSAYSGLPPCVQWVRDSSDAALSAFMSNQAAAEAGFPHLVVLDSQDRIRYAASGYKIGTGKEALHILTALRQQHTEWRDS
ncbi:transglutaminase domain-containing protein [Paenibacillus harenae]|uniref:transglutaminase domain-containing protein n=1 Tax=Paenibacillus harenae TaxID=306543 RepID=UPI0004051E5E|nr:transglutaminase domain-containing protein [Paenibacillus harenae]